MPVKLFGATHVGMKRLQNQDNFLVLPELNPQISVCAVADGMGGHKGGETASLMCIETLSDYFKKKTANGGLTANPEQSLQEAFLAANSAIQKKSIATESLNGMGTTTTALLFIGPKLYIANVGDSRTYLIQRDRIWPITRDHSVVQEKLQAGLITREQTKTDKMRNVLTRAVGFESMLDVDVYAMDIKKGDLFLVCSDGLYTMVDDAKICETFQKILKTGISLEKAAEELIDLANQGGGEDNITTILAQVV
jgi:protein phosphatase